MKNKTNSFTYQNRLNNEKPEIGDLEIWWLPQVPGDEPFRMAVKSPAVARLLLDVLADYDLYQLAHRIKPDFSNAGGLEVWADNADGDGNAGWEDWYDEKGYCVDDYVIGADGELRLADLESL